MKKKYYVLENEDGCFCSHCGCKILKDSYLFKKHGENCGIHFENNCSIYKDGEVYGYAFQSTQEDALLFSVFRLKLGAKISKNKYESGSWIRIFKAIFEKDSKIVKEKGLYNVDVWFKKLVNTEFAICLNEKEPLQHILKYFKSIPFIYSYGMFLDIYRQRGYHYNEINIAKLMELKQEPIGFKKGNKISSKTYFQLCEIQVDEEIVLQIDIYSHNKYFDTVFISKDFYYNPNNVDLKSIFLNNQEFLFTGSTALFQEKYPEIMLQNYLESGGENIFKAIMSPNYNKLFENIAKCGCGIVADHIEEIPVLNIYGNNVKDIFGFHVHILKKLNYYVDYLKTYPYLEVILNVLKKQPAVFDLELNDNAWEFLMNSFHSQNDFNVSKLVSRFDKHEILRAVKMFVLQEGSYFFLYCDYIRLCEELEVFPDGLIPTNLLLAHDYATELHSIKVNSVSEQLFHKSVNQIKYLMFQSRAYIGEDHLVHIKKDDDEDVKFIIKTPKVSTDLIRESEILGHCVKTYIKAVEEEKTFILFLRKKESAHIPFATIEVTNKGELIQLKTKNNQKAPKEAQDYVREWAKKHNVKIKSSDFN